MTFPPYVALNTCMCVFFLPSLLLPYHTTEAVETLYHSIC